jgi:hypothetical protein
MLQAEGSLHEVCAEACAAWPVCPYGQALPVNDAAYERAIDVR